MEGMNRVATYARVSISIQAEEGKSLAAQKAEMHEFAEARGWTIVAEFVDPGLSGTDMNRPALEEALAAAEEKTFDILLVHELSRLSRRLYDTLGIFEKLGKLGVGFSSVKEPSFDFSNPTGRLILTMLAALNQYYVDLLKMHTAKSKRERARQGLYNASITPFGYRHVGDADTPPEIVPAEAEVVLEMFRRYATGEHSYQEIGDWLSDAGHRTRAGRRFAKDTVADMIRNPFYRGDVVYRQGERGEGAGEVFEGQHEGIVERELWEMCHQVRERRRCAPRTYQPHYRVYLLNGIVNCDVCGRKLRAQGTRSGEYYREVSKQRGFADCPVSGRGVRTEEIDAQIGAVFRRLRLPLDWQKQLAEMVKQDEGIETLENRRARLVAERRRLKEMKIRGEFEDDLDIYEREQARIRRGLAELPAPADMEVVKSAAVMIGEMAEVWDEAEKVDKRDLLRLVLHKVQIDVLQGRLATIEPYPVFVPLFRHVSLLRECDFGIFSPVWPTEIVEELEVMETLQPLEEAPIPGQALDWPLVTALPAEMNGERITPVLSKWLKKRRRDGAALGPVAELRHPPAPELQVDLRKWAEVEMRRVENLSKLEPGSVGFLWTPFALQREAEKASLLNEARRVVESGGTWAFVDVLPASMAGHWVYQVFSDAWKGERELTWDTFQVYNELVKAGFEVSLKQRSFHQAVALEVAWRMASERERCPQLKLLPDAVYEEGLAGLKEELEREGGATQKPSEFCLMEVTAVKK